MQSIEYGNKYRYRAVVLVHCTIVQVRYRYEYCQWYKVWYSYEYEQGLATASHRGDKVYKFKLVLSGFYKI